MSMVATMAELYRFVKKPDMQSSTMRPWMGATGLVAFMRD
jgi:hypothetical protein